MIWYYMIWYDMILTRIELHPNSNELTHAIHVQSQIRRYAVATEEVATKHVLHSPSNTHRWHFNQKPFLLKGNFFFSKPVRIIRIGQNLSKSWKNSANHRGGWESAWHTAKPMATHGSASLSSHGPLASSSAARLERKLGL
jgi:hypothetical protein